MRSSSFRPSSPDRFGSSARAAGKGARPPKEVEKVGEARKENPEPARGVSSAPAGAMEKAGRVWVVEIYDHGGKVAKRLITRDPMKFFLKGDGWKRVNKNVWFRVNGKRLEVVRINGGKVWLETFRDSGLEVSEPLGAVEELEVVR